MISWRASVSYQSEFAEEGSRQSSARKTETGGELYDDGA